MESKNRVKAVEGDKVELVAKLSAVVFDNPDTRFSIQKVQVKALKVGILDGISFVGGLVTVRGYGLPSCRNINYDIAGTWVYNPKYGYQVDVVSYNETAEKGRKAVVHFLTHGPIKGIGEKTAERIYDVFGDKTMEILKTDPKQLMDVKGINTKTLKKVVDSWNESRKARETMELLMPYGFEAYLCMRAYNRFENMTTSVILFDIYRLCEVPGFAFPAVDNMAIKRGLHPESQSRVSAAVNYVLKANEMCGDLGMRDNDLLRELKRTLAVNLPSDEYLSKIVNMMLAEKEIRATRLTGETLVYRSVTFNTELALAKKLIEMKHAPVRKVDVEKVISKVVKKLDFTLAPEQMEAIRMSLMTNVMVITGGPGVGKTTVLKEICNAAEEAGDAIILMSTTGKAAKQMTESTGRYATTEDSALQLGAEDGNFSSDIEIEAGLVVCDEVSMMDIYHAAALVKALKPGCRLILVGDIDQLPSVGAGAVLRDTIESGCIPVVRLKTIFRQKGAEGQLIVENAQKINAGDTELTTGDGFLYIEETDGDEAMAKDVIRTYLSEVKKHGSENVVCLIPTKDTPFIGVHAMNRALQEIVNPEHPDKSEVRFGDTVFRQGDLVMNVKNDLKKKVVNGDVGYVKSAYVDRDRIRTVECVFDNRTVEYKGDEELRKVTLAYAMTVHKAQGSEYKSVVIALPSRAGRTLLKRNLIYTAITRASKSVHMFGTLSALTTGITTQDTTVRKTILKKCLQGFEQKRLNK